MAVDSWFHKIQIGDGVICETINDMMQELRDTDSCCYKYSCVFYPLAFILVTVGPVLAYVLFVALMPIYWFFYAIGEAIEWTSNCSRGLFPGHFVFFWPILVISYIWCVIKIVGCLIIGTFAVVGTYLTVIILLFVGLFRFCLCKSHKRANASRVEALLAH